MKALRYYGPGDIRIEATPMPELHPGEVMVRVHSAGVCATDVKTYQRGHPKIQPGSVIGHEIAGILTDVYQADGWKVGDRVTVAPYAPCLECSQCERERYTTCDRLFEQGIDPGGFAEYVRVPARIVAQGLVRLPEEVPLSLGALTEPLACCIHGLEALCLQPEDTMLVIGDGTMGLMQALLAKKMGVQKVILSGMIPERLARAREIADVVIDASQEDLVDALKRIAPQGADKVIVSVGDTHVVESSLKFVRKGGILNIYAGMPKGQMMSLDPNQIHYDEVSLVGTFGFTPKHFHQAVSLLAPMREGLEKVLSGSVQIDDVLTALDAMAEYRGVKYLVNFPG